VNDPVGSRLPVAAETVFCPDHHSFALLFLRKLALDDLLAPEILAQSFLGPWLSVTGGFLVLVLAEGQQPPSIRVGREGRTRPMPYASMTLSGSREEKRTHLFFGEPNSCPGTLRSLLQSRSSSSRDSSSRPPFANALCLWPGASALGYSKLGV
jgi:hypothetical protein